MMEKLKASHKRLQEAIAYLKTHEIAINKHVFDDLYFTLKDAERYMNEFISEAAPVELPKQEPSIG